MPSPVFALALLLALVLADFPPARSAFAQSTVPLEAPRQRQGYYLSGGFHAAASGIWEEDRDGVLWPGTSMSFRAGQLLTRRLGLGLDLEISGTSDNPEIASLIALGLEGQISLFSQFALRGMFGMGVVSLSNRNRPNDDLRGTYGATGALAISYDWFLTRSRLSGGVALTPVLTARVISGDGANAVLGLLGVELTYWTGLPRNQLDLPPSEAYRRE